MQATKESVLPVPNALDSFFPLSRAKAESPVSRSALASPAYDTTISNLSGLVCYGSNGAFCPPGYPLTASVEQPGSHSTDAQTPTPEIGTGPLVIGAGFGVAHADAGQVFARSAAQSLRIGMATSASNAAAVTRLRKSLRRAAPDWRADADAEDALVSVGAMRTSADVVVRDGVATAVGVADLSDVQLVQGTIGIRAIHSELTLTGGSAKAVFGGPEFSGVTVGPFTAVVDQAGLHVADQDVPAPFVDQLNGALAQLAPLVTIQLAQSVTTPRAGGADAMLTALTVSYRRELVENTGSEVVQLHLGRVRASATHLANAADAQATASGASAPPASSGAASTRPRAADTVLGDAPVAPPSVLAAPVPVSGTLSTRGAPVELRRALAILPHTPAGVVVLSILFGLALAIGLWALSVDQVLRA